MNTGVSLVSNGGADPLSVWIEPWCDELVMPPHSTLSCATLDAPTDGPVADLELNAEGTLVVWAAVPGRMIFTIDGIVQDTGSREIALPAGLLAVPVKQFVNIAFDQHPQARPGGVPAIEPEPSSWWRELRRFVSR